MHKPALLIATALSIFVSAGVATADKGKSYLADQVELRHIDYDVTVSQWDRKTVRIKVLGELPNTPAIHSRLDNGRLVVRSTDRYSSQSNILVTAEGAGATSSISIGTGSRAVVVQSNGIHIAAANTAPRPSIEISLPPGVDLRLEEFSGEANIEQLPGRLNFSGSGSLRAQKLGDSNIEAWGNAELRVERIDGAVDVRLADNAELTMDGGRVSAIEIRSRDNAEAMLGVSAQSATLDAADNAEIQIRQVRDEPRMNVADNAEIRVRNWP